MASNNIHSATSTISARLIVLAMERRTTTYEELAGLVGIPNRGNQMAKTIGGLLTHIFHFCIEKNWPHLTSLVVRKSGTNAGLPGSGFWNLLEEVGAEEAKAYTSGALFCAPKNVRASIAGYLQLRCYAYFEKLNGPSVFEEYHIADSGRLQRPPSGYSKNAAAPTDSELAEIPYFNLLKECEREFIKSRFSRCGMDELEEFISLVLNRSADLPMTLPSNLHHLRSRFAGLRIPGEGGKTYYEVSQEVCWHITGYKELRVDEQQFLIRHLAARSPLARDREISIINNLGFNIPVARIRQYLLNEENPT